MAKRPKYYYIFKAKVNGLSCPELKWLEKAIEEVKKERKAKWKG